MASRGTAVLSSTETPALEQRYRPAGGVDRLEEQIEREITKHEIHQASTADLVDRSAA